MTGRRPTRSTRGGAASNAGASQSQATDPTTAAADAAAGSAPPRGAATRSAAAGTAGRGRGGTAATAAAASSRAGATKFRPKGNRRTESERERIAQEQQRIQSKKMAEDARQRSRGRFRRAGRARGGFRDRDPRFATASGPLSSGMGAGPAGSFGAGGSGFRGGGGAGGGAGFRGKAGVSRGISNKYSFAEGIADDNRINADELRGRAGDSDEDDNGAKITSTARRRRPIMPVGIERVEYQDKGVTVATAADIEGEEKGLVKKEEGSESEEMWIDGPVVKDGEGVEMEKDEGVWAHAAPKPHGKVKIKKEDGEMIETMDIDEIAAHGQIKEPLSPEAKKAAIASDLEAEQKRRKAAPRDPEEETLSQDLEQLLSLLALEPEGEGIQPRSALEGNMFLFQFPPVLPPLKKSTTFGSKDTVKDEPNDDVVMFDQSVNGTPGNVDLTAEDAEKVKREEGDEEGLEDGDNSSDPYQEGGYVGKLVMRKSGKVELSWGGQTLELVSGAPAQFLTSAVLLEETDSKAKPGQIAGTAYGMGKIEGKFVLAPKWGDEEEWEVDPDDLPPGDAPVL